MVTLASELQRTCRRGGTITKSNDGGLDDHCAVASTIVGVVVGISVNGYRYRRPHPVCGSPTKRAELHTRRQAETRLNGGSLCYAGLMRFAFGIGRRETRSSLAGHLAALVREATVEMSLLDISPRLRASGIE